MRLLGFCAAASVVATAHTLINAVLLRRPSADPPPVTTSVSVLLPVRNEVGRVAPCLRSVLDQQRVADPLEIVVLDDGSTDGTTAEVRRIAGRDGRVRLVPGSTLPEGWLGKPYACQQLAALARRESEILIFLDADVVLAPTAVAAVVDLLLSNALQVVCPYPRQIAVTAAERLVQPLLQWSWLTFLPLRVAERSPRPSLTAGNGQLLAVRRDAYDRAGGHAAVRADVVEDVALVRAIKAAGGRGGVVDGTEIAACRMYAGWDDVRDGYTKSLWAAFGSPVRGAGVAALLAGAYVLPAAAAVRGSRAGLLAYAAGVASRAIAANRTGARIMPDCLAHPLSIGAFCWLVGRSLLHHRRGALTWKGRVIATSGHGVRR